MPRIFSTVLAACLLTLESTSLLQAQSSEEPARPEARIESWLREGHRLADLFAPIAKKIQPAVCEVRFQQKDDEVRLAALLVSPEGEVLVKASELESEGEITVHRHDGKTFKARRAARLASCDLALLKIEGSDHPFIDVLRSRRQLELRPGDLLLSFGIQEGAFEVGVMSRAPFSVLEDAGGWLGINFASFKDYGAVVSSLEEKSPARKAGLQSGDAILAVEGTKTANKGDVMAALRKFPPGRTIKLGIRRGTTKMDLSVTLSEAPQAPMGPGGRGAPTALSRHRGPYPEAFLHDGIVAPAHCGGPVTDLEGRLIGLNIARSTRTDTVTLTTRVLRDALVRLRGEAARRSQAERRKRIRQRP